MDVRVKFAVSMIGFSLFIIALSIVVYLVIRDVAEPEPASPLPATRIEIDATNADVVGFNSLLGTTPATEDAAPPQEPEPTLLLTTPAIPDETNRRTRVPQTPTEQVYEVRMHVTWSDHVHPQWYPSGAHISPMVAWSHRTGTDIYATDNIASEGLEIVAETGATRVIERAIQGAQNKGLITDYGIGKRIDAPGEDAVQLRVAEHTPYVTVVSMIAPSPDWFVVARQIPLFTGGSWVERKRYTSRVYDAGTDSGTTFSAANRNTNPQQPITLLKNQPSIPIVTFEFIRMH